LWQNGIPGLDQVERGSGLTMFVECVFLVVTCFTLPHYCGYTDDKLKLNTLCTCCEYNSIDPAGYILS
jgi:hypothetical protein